MHLPQGYLTLSMLHETRFNLHHGQEIAGFLSSLFVSDAFSVDEHSFETGCMPDVWDTYQSVSYGRVYK